MYIYFSLVVDRASWFVSERALYYERERFSSPLERREKDVLSVKPAAFLDRK